MFTKEAANVCKTILRNGYDAYTINATLQKEIFEFSQNKEVDIACECDFETLGKFFPNIELSHDEGALAQLRSDSGILFRFYPINIHESANPDLGVMRISPHMIDTLQNINHDLYNAVKCLTNSDCVESFFEDRTLGAIKLVGVPFLTLERNYSLAITALRMAANYDLPIEPETWLAIIRSSHSISDYVPTSVFMQEMRLVAAENLWKFIQLLSDSFILHAILPEVASLQAIKQQINKDDTSEETVFQHTLDCMRFYPEEKLHHDWVGVVALLFHDIGKLYTAEFFEGRWTFYQYHRVGVQMTRAILRRFHIASEDTDVICNLVRDHIRFHSMLTDKGIRRFQALPNTQRLIEMSRAHIKATKMSYTNFNHNLKYLERADTPEQMLEPLLNGNEIMEFTGLPPSKAIGVIRESLLQAQINGKVTDLASAIEFVKQYIS